MVLPWFQWAKIILVVEQTVTTKERIQQQIKYSEPMKDGRLALVIRWHQTVSRGTISLLSFKYKSSEFQVYLNTNLNTLDGI